MLRMNPRLLLLEDLELELLENHLRPLQLDCLSAGTRK
jgi:hypothetical protein